MKVGISTASLYGKLYTEQALEFFAQNSVDCAEVFLSSFSEYKEEFGRELQRVKGNVEVYSIHTLNSQFEGQLFSRSASAVCRRTGNFYICSASGQYAGS